MTPTRTLIVAGAALALLSACTESGDDAGSGGDGSATTTRDQVRVVGSSTVYPFSSYVAEELGAISDHPTPVVESTGTGGGMKLFCAGDGLDTPDITNASRPMQPSELQRCQDNGVTDITEAMIGYDGIVIAQAKENEPLDLTREQVALAVAAQVPQDGELVDNPYERWNEIDASLPDREILIYGPPTTSGTRDAFEELVIEAAAAEMPGYPDGYASVRQDGLFVPSGENDNLIVQKIEQNRDSIGVFGYSFLDENRNRIQAASVGGREPTPENISSGDYPVSRSLFFYTKNSHFDRVPGMDAYVELFMSDQVIGPDGYLRDLGLIALPEEARERARQRVAEREQVESSDLKAH
ncbi:MAG: PstS family phosphate ABC transporter substrate-binding protein [Halofilum sp. (in: g-proteobacteria)]|nr:PstS family phosphate ABC transporter substrate-binding protein [Halofilum sp. (in: g-proteobacteria)]